MPPVIFITINKLPMVSATNCNPQIASIMNIKSPKIIPAVTANPLAISSVAERVTTSITLVLGTMASISIIINSERESTKLIFKPDIYPFSISGLAFFASSLDCQFIDENIFSQAFVHLTLKIQKSLMVSKYTCYFISR